MGKLGLVSVSGPFVLYAMAIGLVGCAACLGQSDSALPSDREVEFHGITLGARYSDVRPLLSAACTGSESIASADELATGFFKQAKSLMRLEDSIAWLKCFDIAGERRSVYVFLDRKASDEKDARVERMIVPLERYSNEFAKQTFVALKDKYGLSDVNKTDLDEFDRGDREQAEICFVECRVRLQFVHFVGQRDVAVVRVVYASGRDAKRVRQDRDKRRLKPTDF